MNVDQGAQTDVNAFCFPIYFVSVQRFKALCYKPESRGLET
jgi:hypothetical protein